MIFWISNSAVPLRIVQGDRLYWILYLDIFERKSSRSQHDIPCKLNPLSPKKKIQNCHCIVWLRQMGWTRFMTPIVWHLLACLNYKPGTESKVSQTANFCCAGTVCNVQRRPAYVRKKQRIGPCDKQGQNCPPVIFYVRNRPLVTSLPVLDPFDFSRK